LAMPPATVDQMALAVLSKPPPTVVHSAVPGVGIGIACLVFVTAANRAVAVRDDVREPRFTAASDRGADCAALGRVSGEATD
jgi:hypothetical protein